jgi:hypothetical protein
MITVIIFWSDQDDQDHHGGGPGVRLPEMPFEEQGWPQFLVGMLIVSPIFGAISAGRWVASTLADQTAQASAITAFIVGWLFIALSARLAHPSRPSRNSLIAGDAALASIAFGMVILIAYRDWALWAIMIGVTIAIFSIVAYGIDRLRAKFGNEDGAAEG